MSPSNYFSPYVLIASLVLTQFLIRKLSRGFFQYELLRRSSATYKPKSWNVESTSSSDEVKSRSLYDTRVQMYWMKNWNNISKDPFGCLYFMELYRDMTTQKSASGHRFGSGSTFLDGFLFLETHFFLQGSHSSFFLLSFPKRCLCWKKNMCITLMRLSQRGTIQRRVKIVKRSWSTHTHGHCKMCGRHVHQTSPDNGFPLEWIIASKIRLFRQPNIWLMGFVHFI